MKSGRGEADLCEWQFLSGQAYCALEWENLHERVVFFWSI